jgi:nicotinate phosphoribosyltransferase
MTVIDGKRLDPDVFGIDRRMRDGRYTDQYFVNVRDILARIADEGYRFDGDGADLREAGAEVDPAAVDVGNIHAEMQCFTKREPFAVACGVDHAIAIIKTCTGFTDSGDEWHNTAADLAVEAVHDGAKLEPWVPALTIRGRYRDFAILETVVLGAMARATKVATRAYELLQAAGGKPVFFFPARFDLPAAQASDGYAYKVAVDVYNRDTGRDVPAMITTTAQGEWFGGTGGGTVSHSYVLSFLKDCAESMLHFARLMPPDVPRVALVDTRGNCVRDSVLTALAMFRRWRELRQAGRADEAERYRLTAVRCDTGGEVRDASVKPTGDPKTDHGVVPQLIRNVRSALDTLHASGDVDDAARDAAREYFRGVKIVASGGFDTEKIAWFESENVPVDLYGVGSAFLTGPACDYTADVVRIRPGQEWLDFAKTGRRPVANPDLEPVPMP